MTKPTFADPAGFMKRAAALMREHAAAAYPGPWISDDSDQCWRLHSAPDPRFPTAQILKAPKHGTPYEEYWPDAGTAKHITQWHPGVTVQVAQLFDVIRQTPPTPDNGVGMLWIIALQLAAEYLDAAGADDDEDDE